MNFPIYRPRRLRRNERLRELIRETSLEPRNFIYPLFVGPGKRQSPADFLHARHCAAIGGSSCRRMRRSPDRSAFPP